MSTATDIHTSCPSCRHELRIPTKFMGQRVSCKHCGHEFTPGVEERPSVAPPPPPAAQPANAPTAIHAMTGGEEIDRHYRVTRLSLASAAFQRQLEEALNRAAGEGWSLLTVVHHDSDCYVVLRRSVH